MEHLPYPQQVAIELARTLKPGGLLFYSAPLSFHEHEVPYDFYRYTQFGVRHIFTEAGFEVPEVLWLEGYLGTVSYQLTRMRKKIPSTARAYGGGLTGFFLAVTFTLFRFLAAILAFLAAIADRRHKWLGSGEPVNYYVVLKKPEVSKTPP